MTHPAPSLDASSLSPRAQAQLLALEAHHPAVARALSRLGREISFPRGITSQAGEAKGTRINATIGQVTDGHGGALPLPLVHGLIGPFSPEQTVLYAPQGGVGSLRQAWHR